GTRPLVQGPLEIRQVFLRDLDGFDLVVDRDVDDAIRHLNTHRPDFLWPIDAKPAPLDHRRTAHADGRVGAGDNRVTAAKHRGVAGEAAARGDPDKWDEAAQARKAVDGVEL